MSKIVTVPDDLYKFVEAEAFRRRVSVEQVFEEWVLQRLAIEQDRADNNTLSVQGENPTTDVDAESSGP